MTTTTDSPLFKVALGFAPGAIGGFCNVIVGHPIDLVKVRMQTASSATTTVSRSGSASLVAAATDASTVGMLRNILLKEGVGGLYAGVTAPLLAVVPAFALVFWSYDFASSVQLEHVNKGAAPLTLGQQAIAGGFTGIPLGMVLGPLERIKCLMQVDKSRYSGFQDCVRQVYREGGTRSLLRGTGLTILRDVPGNAAYFGAFELSRQVLTKLEGRKEPSLATTFVAGGLAGVANWIVAIPIDVVKSRWQTAAPGTYSNIGQVTSTLLAKEGPGAFFKGVGPALLRAFPANAACLVGVETTRTVMGMFSQQ